jgi:hypothetical protein
MDIRLSRCIARTALAAKLYKTAPPMPIGCLLCLVMTPRHEGTALRDDFEQREVRCVSTASVEGGYKLSFRQGM